MRLGRRRRSTKSKIPLPPGFCQLPNSPQGAGHEVRLDAAHPTALFFCWIEVTHFFFCRLALRLSDNRQHSDQGCIAPKSSAIENQATAAIQINLCRTSLPSKPTRWSLAGICRPWPVSICEGPPSPMRAATYVAVSDDDQVVLHDDCPVGWQAGGRRRVASRALRVLFQPLHGADCRKAQRCRRPRVSQGSARCGAGTLWRGLPYHSGRSDDAAAALHFIARLCPRSPTTIIGFSLGANVTLKLLGELGNSRCGGLDSAVAVCPPVDLMACSRNLSRWSNKIYDDHFVRNLWQAARGKCSQNGSTNHSRGLHSNGSPPFRLPNRRPRRL